MQSVSQILNSLKMFPDLRAESVSGLVVPPVTDEQQYRSKPGLNFLSIAAYVFCLLMAEVASAQTVSVFLDSSGDGAGSVLDGPEDVIVDHLDNVYVSGNDSNNIFKVSSAGTITEILDSSDGLGKPSGLDLDSNGDLYVAVGQQNTVIRVTTGGIVTTLIDETGDGVVDLNTPINVAVGSPGEIAVNNYAQFEIFHRTAAGAITSFSAQDQFPWDVEIDSTGNTFWSVNFFEQQVYKRDTAGTITAVFPDDFLLSPFGIVVDSTDNLYVASGNGAHKVTPGGVVTELLDTTGDGAGNTFGGGRSIAVDIAGNAYVSGRATNNVFKIASDGTVKEIIDGNGVPGGINLDQPRNLAVDSKGNIYLTSPIQDVVFKITPIAPTITSSSYDANTGVLQVTGQDFFPLSGVNNDIDASLLSFVGDGGVVYTLTDTSDVDFANTTSFSLNLSATDQVEVNSLLSRNGAVAADGTTYNLAAAEDWAAGSEAAGEVANLTDNAITVVNSPLPSLTSASYDFDTGLLLVTAANLFQFPGASNDIDASVLSITGEGGVSYTLTDTADVDISSATAFSLTLSATDRAAVNQLINKNGTGSTDGTSYELAAAENWALSALPADAIADASGNSIAVSNVPLPTITSATYAYDAGVLQVIGAGFSIASGGTNDIDVSQISLTGRAAVSYTLTDTADVEILSTTTFSIALSATDKAEVNQLLDKNGGNSSDSSAYNLEAAEDWAMGADSALAVADLLANAITVTGVPLPTPTVPTVSPPRIGSSSIDLTLGDGLSSNIFGGIPPFTVVSDDPSIAAAEIVNGELVLTGLSEGTVSLLITDALGQTARIFVNVEMSAEQQLLSRLGLLATSDDATEFRGGSSADGGSTFFTAGAFSVGEMLSIIFHITPKSMHLGSTATVVVAIVNEVSPELIWLLTEDGSLTAYDNETLIGMDDTVLTESIFVDVTAGSPIEITAAEVGLYEFFVGYLLPSGELVYASEPVIIEVVP